MRNADGISLQKAIVHSLNPRLPNGVVFSERDLPLEAASPITDFLVAHIGNSLRDAAARSAKFLDDGTPSSFMALCRKLLADNRSFVDVSTKIATRLNSIIESDKRVSPGSLVVCCYAAANKPDVAKFLALLKLDPSKVFQQVAQKDEKGRRFVTFTPAKNAVPTSGERLQKCAFIRPLDPRSADYDLMILDRQKTGADEPADYFISTFLSAALAADPRTLTRDFYKAATRGLNAIASTIGVDKYEIVKTAINSAVNGRSIEVDSWLENLNIDENSRQQLAAVIKTELPDPAFSVDETVARTLTRKRIFQGRFNLRIAVDSDHYNDVVKSRKPKHSSQSGDYVEILIHAQDLKEMER